jgi:hypothetical protein
MALADPVLTGPAGWSDYQVRRWLERRIEDPARANRAGSGRLSSDAGGHATRSQYTRTRKDETVYVL